MFSFKNVMMHSYLFLLLYDSFFKIKILLFAFFVTLLSIFFYFLNSKIDISLCLATCYA